MIEITADMQRALDYVAAPPNRSMAIGEAVMDMLAEARDAYDLGEDQYAWALIGIASAVALEQRAIRITQTLPVVMPPGTYVTQGVPPEILERDGE